MSRNNKYISFFDKFKRKNLILEGDSIQVFFDFFSVFNGYRNVVYAYNRDEKSFEKDLHLAKIFDMDCLYLGDEKGTKQHIFYGNKSIITLISELERFDILRLNIDYLHWLLGKVCRIPGCCIEKFFENGCNVVKSAELFMKQLNGEKDPYKISINGRKVSQFLINYVPCSPDCKQTKNLFKTYKYLWREMFKCYGLSVDEFKKMKKDGKLEDYAE